MAAPGGVSESEAPRGGASRGVCVLFALCLLLFCGLQYRHLGYPLLWQDEAETVMFGQRILDYGYPRVDDGRNLVYGLGVPLAVGVKEEHGAYIGSLWGQYYFAAPAVRWAAGAHGFHARTARLRLPFALTGSLGLLLLFLSTAPLLGSGRREQMLAASAFLMLSASSVSLLLHLREVRYYALAVALLAAIVWLELRSERLSTRVRACLLVLALLALFNVFYPACVAAAAWILLEAALAAGRDSRRRRQALQRALPVLIAAGLAGPIAGYFELLSVSSLFSARWGFGPADQLANLRAALYFLLRYEWLAAACAARAALLLCWLADGRETPPGLRPRLAGASSLWRLGALFVLVGSRNPIFFERYFVPVFPLLALVLLLDAASLFAWLRRARFEGLRRLAGVLALAAVVATCWMKSPELAGRVAELRTPYRGPLDFVIPYLAERYEDPARLRIATNYEAESYMYYLGSEVVGRFHVGTPESRAAELSRPVDVIVPRKAQPKNLDALRVWLGRGGFRRHDLPVADLPCNNVPELYRGRVLTWTHQFRTLDAGTELGPLVVYEREDADGPPR